MRRSDLSPVRSVPDNVIATAVDTIATDAFVSPFPCRRQAGHVCSHSPRLADMGSNELISDSVSYFEQEKRDRWHEVLARVELHAHNGR